MMRTDGRGLCADTLKEWLPEAGTGAVCAVSGGLDSMCLLHLLWHWCGERDIPLTAAHFNHRLRATADRDEAFVRDWCRERGIPFVSGSGDVRSCAQERGLSIEEAARELRYRFLREQTERQREETKCHEVFLYTAHHLNDNAETVLLNLIRGTGIRGLAGMRHRHDGLVRPLLNITRTELEAYAALHGICHVEDETNADPDAAARNLLRQKILPLLRELNPKAEEHIHAAAQQLSVIDRALEVEAEKRTAEMELRDGQVRLSVEAFRDAPEAVRPRMVLCALDKLGAGRKNYGAAHLQSVLNLCLETDNRARSLDLPGGVTVRLRQHCLLFAFRPPPLSEAELMPGVPLQWGDFVLTLDAPPDKTGDVLLLRDCKAGNGDRREIWTVKPCRAADRLTLPGAKGSRSVKRLCVDRGIAPAERDRLPAVCVNGRLAAVWRIGVDAAFESDAGFSRLVRVETDHSIGG